MNDATVTLACPNCAAAYAVPRDKLGPNGRTLKCAQCGTRWHAMAPVEELAAAEPVEVASVGEGEGVDWEAPRNADAVATLEAVTEVAEPDADSAQPAALNRPVGEANVVTEAVAPEPSVPELPAPMQLDAFMQVAKTAEVRRQQAPMLRILQDTWAPTLAWALGLGGLVAGVWVWQGEGDDLAELPNDAVAEATQKTSPKMNQKALTDSTVSKTAHAGLVLANVSATLVTGADDRPVLEVFGEIVNAGPGNVTPPPVRLDGLDAKGSVLDLALTSSSMLLAPGEVQTWRLQLPPVNMAELASWRVLWATTAGDAADEKPLPMKQLEVDKPAEHE